MNPKERKQVEKNSADALIVASGLVELWCEYQEHLKEYYGDALYSDGYIRSLDSMQAFIYWLKKRGKL